MSKEKPFFIGFKHGMILGVDETLSIHWKPTDPNASVFLQLVDSYEWEPLKTKLVEEKKSSDQYDWKITVSPGAWQIYLEQQTIIGDRGWTYSPRFYVVPSAQKPPKELANVTFYASNAKDITQPFIFKWNGGCKEWQTLIILFFCSNYKPSVQVWSQNLPKNCGSCEYSGVRDAMDGEYQFVLYFRVGDQDLSFEDNKFTFNRTS